jgi:hypothetical protein
VPVAVPAAVPAAVPVAVPVHVPGKNMRALKAAFNRRRQYTAQYKGVRRSGMDEGTLAQKTRCFAAPSYLSGPIKRRKKRVSKPERIRRYVQRTLNSMMVPDALGVRQRWSNTFTGQYVLRDPETLYAVYEDVLKAAQGDEGTARSELIRGLIQMPNLGEDGTPNISVGDKMLYFYSSPSDPDSDPDSEDDETTSPSSSSTETEIWPCTVTSIDKNKKTFVVTGKYDGSNHSEERMLNWEGAYELAMA